MASLTTHSDDIPDTALPCRCERSWQGLAGSEAWGQMAASLDPRGRRERALQSALESDLRKRRRVGDGE